jgi:copper(I)-binding protein
MTKTCVRAIASLQVGVNTATVRGRAQAAGQAEVNVRQAHVRFRPDGTRDGSVHATIRACES